MLPFLIPTLIVSKQAYEKISQSLPKGDKPRERDGFLLGIDTFRRQYVLDVTIAAPCGEDEETGDPSVHTGQILEIFEKLRHDRLSILGIWRSPPIQRAKETQESSQNREICRETAYCVSVSPSPHTRELALSACYIDFRGKLRPCRVVVESEKYRIPRRYFKPRKNHKNAEPFL